MSRVLFADDVYEKLPDEVKKTAREKDKAVLVKTSDMAVMVVETEEKETTA